MLFRSFIAAEDTRVTMKLLNYLGLKKPMVSYYEHALQKGEAILQRIEAGESCALCSDAGMPGVSDPGLRLVAAAREAGYANMSFFYKKFAECYGCTPAAYRQRLPR